jgi:hypothetical protein
MVPFLIDDYNFINLVINIMTICICVSIYA